MNEAYNMDYQGDQKYLDGTNFNHLNMVGLLHPYILGRTFSLVLNDQQTRILQGILGFIQS